MYIRHRTLKHSLAATASGLAVLCAPAGAQGVETTPQDEDPTWRVEEVDVFGSSLGGMHTSAALPLQVLAGDDLAHRRQATLGETLAGLPGVHLDNFGGGASRPVIRGQTVPRIEILTDGAELFDASSASPDHAVTTDPLLLDGIEILRGPGAAIYGGNAMNGVVNLIDSKVPKALPEDGLDGATEVRYGTGDEEKSFAARATLGIGQLALHAEGSSRDADNYDVPEAFGSDELRDSFAEASSYSVGASWITDRGYIGAAYTVQDAEYGLPGHSHANGVCHTHYYWDYLDLHCSAHADYVDPVTSPDSHTAYIDLRSERVDVRADYEDLVPGLSHVRFRGSYTDYGHDEIDGQTLFTQYTNEVWDGRIDLTHKPLFGFTGTFGVQYTDGTFTGLNINDLAVPFPENDSGFDGVPDYLSENIAVFLSERRSIGPVDLEFAIRKDWREISVTTPPFRSTIEGEDAAWYEENWGPDWLSMIEENDRLNFENQHPETEHDPLSFSLGATWNLNSNYAVGLSLARTERAPSVRELYASGNNMATNSYEQGLTQSPGDWLWDDFPVSLPPSESDLLEKANSINLTFRKAGGAFDFEASFFHQDYENYVFARLVDMDDETGVPHNWLLYTAADATFTGIDGQVSFEVDEASAITVFGDYVRAELSNQDDELPRIPPGRLGARYEWARGPLSADVEFYHTFSQDRIASYETETDSYDMLNATLSYTLEKGPGESVEFYLRANNLADELAFVHTSFVKDQSPLRGRNFVIGIRQAF